MNLEYSEHRNAFYCIQAFEQHYFREWSNLFSKYGSEEYGNLNLMGKIRPQLYDTINDKVLGGKNKLLLPNDGSIEHIDPLAGELNNLLTSMCEDLLSGFTFFDGKCFSELIVNNKKTTCNYIIQYILLQLHIYAEHSIEPSFMVLYGKRVQNNGLHTKATLAQSQILDRAKIFSGKSSIFSQSKALDGITSGVQTLVNNSFSSESAGEGQYERIIAFWKGDNTNSSMSLGDVCEFIESFFGEVVNVEESSFKNFLLKSLSIYEEYKEHYIFDPDVLDKIYCEMGVEILKLKGMGVKTPIILGIILAKLSSGIIKSFTYQKALGLKSGLGDVKTGDSGLGSLRTF